MLISFKLPKLILACAVILAAQALQAQTLVPKWQLTALAAGYRDVAYNPATTHVLVAQTTPAIKRFNNTDGTSAGADLDVSTLLVGTEKLRGLAVQSDGTIWGCNYVTGAQSTTPLNLYKWSSEDAVPELVASSSGTLPGTSSDRFGGGLSVFVRPGVSTNFLVGGNTTIAFFIVFEAGTYTFKQVTVASQTMTPGGTFLDYGVVANRFRFIAKSRGSNGQLYNFDPTAASPITPTATAMSVPWTGVANGITSHDFNPSLGLLAGCSSTIQAAPFSYTNSIFTIASSASAPTQKSFVAQTATAADGGTHGGTCVADDGRVYSLIPVAGAGLNAFDVTAYLVTGPADIAATVGDTVTFTSKFGGSELVYSWKKGNTLITDDSKYAGATTSSLTISNLVASDNDSYTVTVAGVSSSTTNASATLFVNNGPVGPKTWTGGGANDFWNTDANWGGVALNPAGDTAYFDGNTRLSPVMSSSYNVAGVTFNSGAGAFTLGSSAGTLAVVGGITNESANAETMTMPMSLPTGSHTVAANSGNVLLNGAISGAGSITKTGSQPLYIRGSAPNTFSGGLTVSSGTVYLGKSGASNAVVGDISVGANTVVLENSNQIADTAIVDLQTGNGTLSLGAGVTDTIRGFTVGGTAVASVSGNVQLGANAELTITPTIAVGYSSVGITAASPAGTKFIVGSSAGGELRWTPSNLVNTFEKLVISSGGRLRIGHGGNAWLPQDAMLGAVPASFMQDQITINNGHLGLNSALVTTNGSPDPTNTVVVNANRGMTITGIATNETFQNVVFPGKITGTGTLFHSGGADLELRGSNDFSGGLSLGSGSVTVSDPRSLGTGTIAFKANGGALCVAANGLTITNKIDMSAVLTNVFGGPYNSTNFTLSGTVNLGSSGSSPIIRLINADSGVTFTGALTNTLGLVKDGLGKLVLAGASTYVGATSVSNGTLVVSNSTGSATSTNSVTIHVPATLEGNGIITGPVTINGTVSPGSIVGNLRTGTETWNGGGHYKWEMNNATGVAGTGWDKITVTGGLTINANSGSKFLIDLTSLAGSVAGNAANFNNTVAQTWTILSTTTGITGFDTNAFSLVTSGFSNPLGDATFEIAQVGNDLVLKLVVPQSGVQNFVTTGAGNGSFTGSPNTSYTVQYTDSLNPINWQPLLTVMTDGSGFGSYSDPGPKPSQRFYRISLP